MNILFLCLISLSLATKLNFITSKLVYSYLLQMLDAIRPEVPYATGLPPKMRHGTKTEKENGVQELIIPGSDKEES